MNISNNSDKVDGNLLGKHQHLDSTPSHNRVFKIRNMLNILFMIGAVIGVLIYFFSNHTVGTIVILISMIFKIIETSIRFFNK